MSYISLDKCEEILRKEYTINEKNKIFIAEMLNSNNNEQLVFQIFDENSNELDISKCEGQTITKHYPILKNSSDISLASKLLSKTELDDFDIYNVSSSYYSVPCAFITVEKKDYSLIERQEMYVYDINHCDSRCEYKSYSKSGKELQCECKSSVELASIYQEEEKVDDITEYFNSQKSINEYAVAKNMTSKYNKESKEIESNWGLIINNKTILLFYFILNDKKINSYSICGQKENKYVKVSEKGEIKWKNSNNISFAFNVTVIGLTEDSNGEYYLHIM